MTFEDTWKKVSYHTRTLIRGLDLYGDVDEHKFHEEAFLEPQDLFKKALKEGYRSGVADELMEVLSALVISSKGMTREDLEPFLYPSGEEKVAEAFLERARQEALASFEDESLAEIQVALMRQYRSFSASKLENFQEYLELVLKDLVRLKGVGKL